MLHARFVNDFSKWNVTACDSTCAGNLIPAVEAHSVLPTAFEIRSMLTATPIAPTMDEILATAERIAGHVIRSPLLATNFGGSDSNVFLKLENQQPIAVFKARTMANIALTLDSGDAVRGIYTASSGNAGIGLAWIAHKLSLSARVYAPISGPKGKLEAIRKFGADVQLLDDNVWWQLIRNGAHETDPGVYFDAVRSTAALAASGTIGLEISQQLAEVDTVIIPFGGGGLACGIANAIKMLRPAVRIVVAECASAAPVSAAFEAGEPANIEVLPSFISGAGAPSVLPEMWPLVKRLIDDTEVVSVRQVEDTVRLLKKEKDVTAEGAGALSVAAARFCASSHGTTACIVSGGNIDADVMEGILSRPSLPS